MTGKPKICQRCGKEKLIYGYGLCENCYNINFFKWSKKRTTRTFKEHMTGSIKKDVIVKERGNGKQRTEHQRALDRADQWFSRYIRLKHSFIATGASGEKELFCRCYTCGNIKPIKEIDNGHYFNRENMSVRHHVNNARPQCVHCNQYKGGRHLQFKQHLIEEIGQEEFDKMEKLAGISIPVNAMELRERAKYYRNKVNELRDQIGLKVWN